MRHSERRYGLSLAGLAAVASQVWGTAVAHHSFAMFDQQKTQSVTGTVKEFQFTSPHAWLQVLVKDANGAEKEWGFEMSSSAGLHRQGWKKTMFKPGDTVTVSFNPLRNGDPAGSFRSAVDASGKSIGPVRSIRP